MGTLRMVIAFVLLGTGMVFCLLSVIGVFRLKFVLNRMHAAALSDSCGMLFCISGLCVLSGFSFTTLKLILILVVLWMTSPVSGHLLSNLIKITMKNELKDNVVKKELEK